MKKWKDRTTFQKILYIFVWLMVIASIASVVGIAVAPFLEGM